MILKPYITIDDLHRVGACMDGVYEYIQSNELNVTTLSIDEADISNEWISLAFGLTGLGYGYGSGYGDGFGFGYGEWLGLWLSGYGSGSGYGDG